MIENVGYHLMLEVAMISQNQKLFEFLSRGFKIKQKQKSRYQRKRLFEQQKLTERKNKNMMSVTQELFQEKATMEKLCPCKTALTYHTSKKKTKNSNTERQKKRYQQSLLIVRSIHCSCQTQKKNKKKRKKKEEKQKSFPTSKKLLWV